MDMGSSISIVIYGGFIIESYQMMLLLVSLLLLSIVIHRLNQTLLQQLLRLVFVKV